MGRGGQAEKAEDYSDANFDEWSGYGESLFAGTQEDAEDKEADMVFGKIEDYIDGRRRKKREEKVVEKMKEDEKAKKDYQAQFADLKKQLVNVSREEWESLPDAPDLVKLSKR
jgi:pre-mRNA-processing factor 6